MSLLLCLTFVVLTAAGVAAVETRLFRKVLLDPSSWRPTWKDGNVGSRMECLAVCLSMPNCAVATFTSDGVCEGAANTVGAIDHIGAGALVAHMDKDVEPLRCHWNDGHIPAPLPLLGRAELAGMGITRGRCEITCFHEQNSDVAKFTFAEGRCDCMWGNIASSFYPEEVHTFSYARKC